MRILIACALSFGISLFIVSRQYITPIKFDVGAVKNDAQSLIANVSSFHFELPHIQLFSQRIDPTPVSDASIPTEAPAPTIGFDNPTPEDSGEIPSSTPFIQPGQGTNYPTVHPSLTVPTKYVTMAPNPTKKPKPTKAPDVFPVDPSLQRPGTTTDEVFSIASQKTCVSAPVLRAIASIESGGFFDVVDPKYFMLYNSYNWWKSPYLTDVKRACGGYDYDGNTGIIPPDSNFAGQTCGSGMGGDLVVRGPLSVSDYWEGKFKPEAAKLLGVPAVDQRVILDAIVIVGLSVKDSVKPANCNSWTTHDEAKAACSYYGSCGDGYCTTFCNNITKYGGQNCSGVVSQFATSCYN